jgi:hypothetical protein
VSLEVCPCAFNGHQAGTTFESIDLRPQVFGGAFLGTLKQYKSKADAWIYKAIS